MRTSHRGMLLALVLLAGAAALVWAQDAKVDRAVVPLTTPGKTALIKASVFMGGITIKGTAGKEVIVEARLREERIGGKEDESEPELAEAGHEHEGAAEKAKKTAGMKLLPSVGTGLEIDEENNVVSISSESWKRAVDLVIQVPVESDLELTSNNEGSIVVENVSGRIEIQNAVGSIILKSVSGNIIANTVDGEIQAVMTRVTPDKPMSFSTMNGDIDVTFPADVKASLKMKTQQGDIYTAFDLASVATSASKTDAGEAGKYHISFDRFMTGAINGGGPEFAFNSFTGDIYIRKGK